MCVAIKKSTDQLIYRNLTLYQREHSAVWQGRYKANNKWMRVGRDSNSRPTGYPSSVLLIIYANFALRLIFSFSV